MNLDIRKAISEIEVCFTDSEVYYREDGEGGAYVHIDPVDPGSSYQQSATWIGFRVTFQYPHADVYPHYVRIDLARRDRRPLGEGFSSSNFEGQPAIQISRRSNHINPRLDTAAIKVQKVLMWLRKQT